MPHAAANRRAIGAPGALAPRLTLVRDMLRIRSMTTTSAVQFEPSLANLERWAAFGSGGMLLLSGAMRRSPSGFVLAAMSAPLLFRGMTGHWPTMSRSTNGQRAHDTRAALGGPRGVRVRESIRLERSIDEVYRYWRQLENLPSFMRHLVKVRETGGGRSHWVAKGPAGVRVEWDAELINEIENSVIAWRSLTGSDIVTAGSVHFEKARGGRSTQVTVNLQYSAPAGRAGNLIAYLFGRAPSQTIREDLRRFKQLMEAGEAAQAAPRVGPEGERR